MHFIPSVELRSLWMSLSVWALHRAAPRRTMQQRRSSASGSLIRREASSVTVYSAWRRLLVGPPSTDGKPPIGFRYLSAFYLSVSLRYGVALVDEEDEDRWQYDRPHAAHCG